ncbi:hypothetical protein KIN20_031025 [Parelaphostrongylus tenuis]|uniref:Uncharacterized protein n=1 Tax=Parelaphostrongylus tenuis TaxID=148309 RepID=A0AAD5R4R1_PARTN|nr:hypothetical protein KIN20_031025 [Parelaphostrongylus tenuis]
MDDNHDKSRRMEDVLGSAQFVKTDRPHIQTSKKMEAWWNMMRTVRQQRATNESTIVERFPVDVKSSLLFQSLRHRLTQLFRVGVGVDAVFDHHVAFQSS